MSPNSNDLCDLARAYWAKNQPRSAVEAAWTAFDLDPSCREAKQVIADLLEYFPSELALERRVALLQLLADAEVDPIFFSPAGWHLVLRSQVVASDASEDAEFEQLALAFESDELAIALLCEAPVRSPVAERLLTRLRRWLLLSDKWRQHCGLVSALTIQTSLNGGAWPFDQAERARLRNADSAIVAAYLSRTPGSSAVEIEAADPVTRAVKAQYEGWPYPIWTRTMLPEPRRFPDPQTEQDLPIDANLLIAGCGTGREAAKVALTYPNATVTAIDVSEASVDYGHRQCTALGLNNIQFRNLNLYDVAQLGKQFETIYCAGVLHHLPDPERGLGALTDVLRPGGIMSIMVYSRLARLWVPGARSMFISDLAQLPVTDDLLREVRRRFLERPEHPLAAYIMRSEDFATLAGTYDLLLNRHEDHFDIPRIERALKRFGLRLLSFQLPTPAAAFRYDAMFPGDPNHRDTKSWYAFERREPWLFAGMYSFFCRKD